LQGFLLQVEVSEIIAHECDEPNALVDLLDSESLTRQHGRDVDLLAVQAEPPARAATSKRDVSGEWIIDTIVPWGGCLEIPNPVTFINRSAIAS
jgi:hypothetical protein